MYLALASLSKDANITIPILERIADALEYQLSAHYAPVWQSEGVNVRVFPELSAIPKNSEACPLLVFDDADQADALGYHSVDPNGKSFGRVFWSVLQGAGATLLETDVSLSATLSHEALEMVGNPYANFWADTSTGEQEAIELCDRTQADSYRHAGVSLSNFLGPRAFREGPGPYDYMKLLDEPWQIRPGGYVIRRRGTHVYNVFGQEFPEWRKTMLSHKSSRMSKRIRVVKCSQGETP